jgi:hypothetical protein
VILPPLVFPGSLLSFVYFLVRWQASVIIVPPGDVILAQLACPLNDVIFCLHQEQLTYLSTNIGRRQFQGCFRCKLRQCKWPLRKASVNGP